MRLLPAAIAAAALFAPVQEAAAFCGFFVAKADAELFNDASKVVMVRDGDRTVITMVNDYVGDPSEFAMVIPTPTVLEREQINVGGSAEVDHLDAYTAPRLVEYYDSDPCMERYRSGGGVLAEAAPSPAPGFEEVEDSGVTIEAQYTVGEYDILILSAEESDGLQRWLDANGYRTPEAARPILESYIRQGMKFFVARVNLEERARLGGEFLRPIQIAFETERFMLPIRLGTVNARQDQELILFTLTRTGRVETSNYRTARIPSNIDIPLFVQEEFGAFYKAMFHRATDRENGRVVFTEYAWDMGWCDPCAAEPLTAAELRSLGVYWLPEGAESARGVDVFVTRLHVRYNAEDFPEDLRLMETGDRENFQGRYVTRHPFTGAATCAAGKEYRRQLVQRWEQEAQTLANLTGWDIDEIRDKMRVSLRSFEQPGGQVPWWEGVWD